MEFTNRPNLHLDPIRGVGPRVQAEVCTCDLDSSRTLRNDPFLSVASVAVVDTSNNSRS